MIYIFFLIIAILLFIPIKIKLSIEFSNNKLKIKLFNFNIFPKKQKKKKQNKPTPTKHTGSDKKKKENKKVSISIYNLISGLINNSYKPKLKFDFNLGYSLSDAATTAKSYGGINTIFYLIASILNLFFDYKDIQTNISPYFNDDLFLNLKFNCILYINLTQIIFIGVIVLKSIKFKGGALFREKYGA